MIRLEQGQQIPENPNLKVAAPSGDYEDVDLISFYDEAAPEVVAGAFQAQFIRYGSMVYQYNEVEELGRAILATDPDATHTAASYVRMNDTLLGKLKSGTLEPASLRETLAEEEAVMDAASNAADQSVLEEAVEEAGSDSAATPVGEVLGEVSVPADASSSDMSSTTPAVVPEFVPDLTEALLEPAATTTSEAQTLPDAATSTPDVLGLAKKRALGYARQKARKRLLG